MYIFCLQIIFNTFFIYFFVFSVHPLSARAIVSQIVIWSYFFEFFFWKSYVRLSWSCFFTDPHVHPKLLYRYVCVFFCTAMKHGIPESLFFLIWAWLMQCWSIWGTLFFVFVEYATYILNEHLFSFSEFCNIDVAIIFTPFRSFFFLGVFNFLS